MTNYNPSLFEEILALISIYLITLYRIININTADNFSNEVVFIGLLLLLLVLFGAVVGLSLNDLISETSHDVKSQKSKKVKVRKFVDKGFFKGGDSSD